jgi:hypothetical protein
MGMDGYVVMYVGRGVCVACVVVYVCRVSIVSIVCKCVCKDSLRKAPGPVWYCIGKDAKEEEGKEGD